MPAGHKREPVYALGEATLAPGLRVYFRWHIEGKEHVPATGPALVASNHISYLDGLSVAYAVHRCGRRPRFLTKSSLFKVPVIGAALKGLGQIPVYRGTRDAPQSLRHAAEGLRNGEAVVVFPEGTTTTTPDLALGKPKTGTARLALAAGQDIIPAATWGGQWIWTKHLGVHLKPRQDVWIRFGPPISIAPWAGREDDREAWREISDLLMARIKEMLDELRLVKPWAPQEPTRPKFIAEQKAKQEAFAKARVEARAQMDAAKAKAREAEEANGANRAAGTKAADASPQPAEPQAAGTAATPDPAGES